MSTVRVRARSKAIHYSCSPPMIFRLGSTQVHWAAWDGSASLRPSFSICPLEHVLTHSHDGEIIAQDSSSRRTLHQCKCLVTLLCVRMSVTPGSC
ncbi:hypothetical protein J6590_002657 [Homalodisca vitripennis]|nr:hypothetical protein J6590_002657 [Homalodisca vitripennis]